MSWLRDLVGVILPLSACLSTWRVVARRTGEWRYSLALSTVAMGLLVAVGTEALSLVGGATAGGYLALYATYGVALLVVGHRLAQSGHVPARLPWWRFRDPLVLICAASGAVLLMLAVAAPPNNWDSMTYHMARVAHWAAQGDVGYYATHIDRQLFTQPWAEYAILQSYVLSGSDIWANLVQWAAMMVTLVMVTLLARNRQLVRPAGVVVITVPSPAVDHLLHLLIRLRLIAGMQAHQHHGFQPDDVLRIFAAPDWRLTKRKRFQLGLNNLFVFRRQEPA